MTGSGLTGINIVFILVVLFFIISMAIGYNRGFIKTFFATFSLAIAVFIAVQGSPYVGKILQRTPIYTGIAGQIEERLNVSGAQEASKVSQQIDAINQYDIPDALKEALIENNNSQIYEALGITRFSEYVAAYLTCLILNVIAFLILFIVVLILLKLIAASLDLISKLPVLHGINKIGGLIFGLVHGLVNLWIVCIILTLFASTSFGQAIFRQINENPFLGMIYNNNYLLVALSNMSKLLF